MQCEQMLRCATACAVQHARSSSLNERALIKLRAGMQPCVMRASTLG